MPSPRIEIMPVEDEAGRVHSLGIWNAVNPERSATLAEALDYQNVCLAHLDVVAILDGEPAGSAFAGIEPGQRNSEAAHAMVAVLPAFRRRGAGTALYRTISAWAGEHGRSQLEAWVDDADPNGLSWATRRGFVEVSRESRVALDLTAIEPPAPDPPPGIEIVTWAERPGIERGLYEVACEAYPDIPGQEHEEMEPFEDWLAHDMGGTGDRPDATFVALAGDEVVGYAKFHLSQARPTMAAHDITGVKHAWRGRGIAGALKRTQIAWAKANGYERLTTGNELRNAPIRRLNARLGYTEIPGRALMRGPLAGS